MTVTIPLWLPPLVFGVFASHVLLVLTEPRGQWASHWFDMVHLVVAPFVLPFFFAARLRDIYLHRRIPAPAVDARLATRDDRVYRVVAVHRSWWLVWSLELQLVEGPAGEPVRPDWRPCAWHLRDGDLVPYLPPILDPHRHTNPAKDS